MTDSPIGITTINRRYEVQQNSDQVERLANPIIYHSQPGFQSKTIAHRLVLVRRRLDNAGQFEHYDNGLWKLI